MAKHSLVGKLKKDQGGIFGMGQFWSGNGAKKARPDKDVIGDLASRKKNEKQQAQDRRAKRAADEMIID